MAGPGGETVHKGLIDPVAGVHHDVGRVDRRPQLRRQVARPRRDVSVRGDDQAHHELCRTTSSAGKTIRQYGATR